MRKRSQSAGTMSRKSARELLGWRLKGAQERHGQRMAEIGALAAKQRTECAQETAQIQAELDAAVASERAAVEAARVARRSAVAAKREATKRQAIAKKDRRAQVAQKRRLCKLEADSIRAEKGGKLHARAKLAKQRDECQQELDQIRGRLAAVVAIQEHARATADAASKAATVARKAHAHRLDVARKQRRAKVAQKKRACKVEADKISATREAERSHHVERVEIERSLLKEQPREARVTLSAREQREQVEADVPEMYRPLWERVKRTFKVPKRAEGRASLLEAFLEYAAENLDQVASAQEEAAVRGMERLQREQRRLAKTRPRAERRQASGYDDDVPF